MKNTESTAVAKPTSRSQRNMSRTYHLALLGLFTAIMVIMAFTPIGYLKIGVLSISFMTLPIIVGATLLTPLDSAFLGAVFGLTSFIQALMTPAGLVGLLLYNVNPVLAFILCFVPRVLEGWLTGLIFKGLQKVDKTKMVSYAVTALSTPILNTVLFMSTLFLLFYNTEPIQKIANTNGATNVFALFIAMVGIQAVVEILVCFFAGTAISKALAVATARLSKKK